MPLSFACGVIPEAAQAACIATAGVTPGQVGATVRVRFVQSTRIKPFATGNGAYSVCHEQYRPLVGLVAY